jgi:hypothetical protein
MSNYHVLAVDIEASGPSLKKNGIVSIGASILDAFSNEKDSFQINLSLPEGKEYEENCLNEFWLKNIQAYNFVQTNATNPKIAMQEFVNFIDNAERFENLKIVSDNPSFDIAWLNHYILEFTERVPLGYTASNEYRIIWDTHSMQKTLLAMKGDSRSEWGLPEKLGLKSHWMHDHNPLNDARTIADYYNQVINELETDCFIQCNGQVDDIELIAPSTPITSTI